MTTRLPFVRPVLTRVFYFLAAALTVVAVLALVLTLVFWGKAQSGLGAFFGFPTGIMLAISLLTQALIAGAIGYIIELLAKIEWNTRS